MITRILIGTFLLLAMVGTQAAMYKWTDAQGNTRFSQFPPAGVKTQRMKAPRAPASSPGKTRPSLQDRLKALEAHKNTEAEEARVKKETQEQTAAKKQNCENAHRTVTLLQRGGNRLYRMPDGSYQRFNAEESQKRVEKSKKYLKKNCS